MKLLLASLLLPITAQERYTPISTSNILAEQYLDSLSYESSLSITSDVPVTLHKYSDTSQSFLMGAEPVPAYLGMVLVTSDCTSEETSLVPTITVEGDDITVTLGVQDNMGFLQGTTRYETFWSYVFGFCGFDYFFSSTTEMNVALIETDAPVGNSGEQSFPTSSPLDVTFIAETTQGTDGTTVSTTTMEYSYESCGFDCCTNTDCDGCCIRGICQPKENEFDLCAEPPIKPGDGECGAVAYKAFQADDNCPTGGLPGAEATVPGQDVTTTTTTTTFQIETASSSTVASMIDQTSTSATLPGQDVITATATTTVQIETATSSTVFSMIDQTSTSPEQGEPNPCVKGKCLNPEGVCEIAVICLNDPCQAENNGCGDAECTANYCGGCNVVCDMASSFVPSTTPSEKPTSVPTFGPVTAAPSSEPITTAPNTPEPATAAPIQSAGVNIPSGPTQNLYPNPPIPDLLPPTESSPLSQPAFDAYLSPSTASSQTPVTPTENQVVNLPVETVPVPVPVDSEDNTVVESQTQTTETTEIADMGSEIDDVSSDILDTPNPSATPIPSSNTISRPVPLQKDDDSFSMSMSMSMIDSEDDDRTPEPSGAPSVGRDNKSTDVVGDSSGFRASFQVQIILTLLAIVIVATLMSGQEGGNFSGFGSLLVAAVAVTALVTRSEKPNMRRSHFDTRKLQDTCTYNVEILFDGCTKSVDINAPAARVIDVVLDDFDSETNDEDQCQTDYSANLTFAASSSNELDLSSNSTVPAYSYSDWQCLRAIEGRPFIDASGKGIQAAPLLVEKCDNKMRVEWSSAVSIELDEIITSNATKVNQTMMLGNEWTQRALGEHSSIASFSAFSIALMTNGAPSSLVEDSLKAGIDEIRHARVSFDIASKLLGEYIVPSSLPESHHLFNHDLTKLALAVAREGCVDETLSAFAGAFEVGEMKNGNPKHYGIDLELVDFIAAELQLITLDETNHSALAWRTLNWICSIDYDACLAVEEEVFDSAKLNMRIEQRFGSETAVASLMKAQWKKIYSAYKMFHPAKSTSVCKSNINEAPDEGIINTISERVMQVFLCPSND